MRFCIQSVLLGREDLYQGFLKTRERDRIKQEKCANNGCDLIYVNESMSFEQVVKELESCLYNKNRGA